MKQMTKTSVLSLFCLRTCLLVYITLAIIFTPTLGEANKYDWNKTMYTEERSDAIKHSEKPAISPHKCKDNKIDGSRNNSANESVMINDERNSVALNRFLEDVLNAQNDLKWIDHATRHINHRNLERLDDPLAHTNQYSTVSVNTGDVLERDDIGYGSRLRGKRDFDRNYKTMWMLQKKKYEQKSTRDVPQRVYLDDDMTFKRNADNTDFDALYQSLGTLDRAVYDGETIADQPLKDWTEKKNLHFSSDWSNSNENPKVTNGESTWLRDYDPREILANSDSSKDEKLHDTDTQDQSEVVALHDPIHANDFTTLQESPVEIRNNITRNAPSLLESLKKTVLKLKSSLISGYKRRNIISKRESNWWNEPRSIVEIHDFGEDYLGHLNKEIIQRPKRAKIIDKENESDSKIFQGVEFGESYFGKQNSKESHDRSKRSRNFVADSNYTDNQRELFTNISENNRKTQMIKDVFENVITTENTEKVVMKLHSDYLNDGKNTINSSNKMNISDSQHSLDKGSFLNNYFNNLTITSSIANKTNISGLRYPSSTELYSNDHFTDSKSSFAIKTNFQTHSPERIIKSENPTNSKEISQQSTIEVILKNMHHTVNNRTNSFEKNTTTTPNMFIDSIHFSIKDNVDNFEKFLKNRNGEEKLKIVTQKISRLGMNDRQSKGAEKEFPRGNTSHDFGIATNELWSCIKTTMAVREKEIEVDGTRKQNHEPIPGVIKVFEPRGRPYQKQKIETTARLSRRMGKDGMSAAKMKTNEDEVDKSRNTRTREDSSTSPIDSVIDVTMKPKAACINTSQTGESIILKDLTSVTVDNDLRKQQQMVPPLNAENRKANKSNGNLDTDRIDILESNGNETMNVKEDTQTIKEIHEYHKSDNNLQRKLLWISTISVDGEIEDSSINNTRSVFNTTVENSIENVTNEKRQQSEIGSANLRKILTKVNREDKIENNRISQDALNSPISETNHYSRYKRSIDPYENFESNNEGNSENIVVEKEAAITRNHDEKQENNEDYLNQNVEELKGSYNDREEDMFEDDDKAMESKREELPSFRQKIDPVRAKVDMLIKQKLDKKHKDSSRYRKKRHMLDTLEYYDYDDNEEQERDAPINEQETQNKNNNLSFAKIRKREDKSPYKTAKLGKKKNENAEAMMKEKLRKTKAKNKAPKEEIVIDLGVRKDKTNGRNDKKPFNSLGSSFENVFNEERQLLTKENLDNIRQNKDFENNAHHEESAAINSKWLDEPFENRMESSKKNSELLLEDSCKKRTNLNEPLKYMANENPDAIKNILLEIQPIKIMGQSREIGASKDFYQDFGDNRPEDRYYYQENDSNNVESLYDELKNVYDWPDSELKSGSRLRGDQRLHYESDDTLDTNPFQLQTLNDRFLGLGQNDNAQRRFQSIDATWMIADSNSTLASNYFALKVTDDMFKGGFAQSSTEENSPNIFSIRTTTESRVLTISGHKNISCPEGRSIIDTDSGSPYENNKYIESKTHEVLKRNLNLEKQAAINSQDLHESFVESLDLHDDFDDNVKVRLGRGLKAIDETVISGFNKTCDQDKKLDVANATNINSKPTQVSLQTFHDNSSMAQNWYNNTIMDLNNIFNNHNVADQSAKNVQESILMNTVNMGGDEDLEAAEQKYVNNQTSRMRRSAASYHTFYDDLNQNQCDSDEMNKSLGNQFHSSNILKNRFDGVYHGYETGNWNSDIQDLDQYSKIPRTNTRKKGKRGKRSKKNKHSSEKRARKSSSHSSSSRNRRHHAHRSDMSRKVNRSDLKPKQKSKTEASPLIGRIRIQKGKTAKQGLFRAEMNKASDKKVLYENVENQSTVKPEEDDARRKEITLLLAADNIDDDESQMDVALHGELAGKIVEQIFQQASPKNDQLKSVFGPGLHRDHKTENVITGNIYRQGLDEDGTNHTETIIKRVMGLLGTLIENEVQKKTCISLSPDMREFLGWMLEVEREEESLEEAPPLPLVREKIIPEQDTGRKFLFDSTSEQVGEESINNLQKKVRVLENLVKEYNTLTAKEKTRVQTVHDYLIRQLNLLLRYIEERETAETKRKPASTFIGAARAGTGNILQYQSAMSNATNASHSTAKDVFSLPINANNLFQFNNTSFKTADKRLHDSHAAPRHRETRSLDKIPSKRHRKIKRQKLRNQKKNKNHRKSKHRHNKKYRRHLSGAGYRKSRQKRANPENNDEASLYYLNYEKPRTYDSFDLLDAKLRGKKKKSKRELVDKKNTSIDHDRMLDLLPIKGKNRMEDEVILLNKREAWKKENEKQLEEVAFGRDMRNSTRRERERFEKLTERDKPINEMSSRMKRENIIRGTSTDKGTDYSNKSIGLEIRDASWNNSKINNNNGIKNDNKLELAERRINVFADNKTNAAIDSAAAEVSMEEKLATNAGTNNQVKGKLGAINRETKIDKADGSTSFVNLTSDAKPRVSKERQKVSVTEKEADDNAVKLNRATNYRREEIDPEIELKNLRQGREKRIYDVANWKMTDYFYDNDKLSRNKLREKYIAKLDKLGDLDTDPENNLVLLRLRNNKWLNDVVEWKLLPIIKRPPYHGDRALARIRLIEKETPNNTGDIDSQSNVYLNNPRFRQLKHRKRNSDFNISHIPRITDNDNFPRRIHRKAKRTSEIERFKDLRIDPKIILKVRRPSRPRNNKRSNSIAEFEMPFTLKDPNREFREILRSRNHPELGGRVIYDGVGLQLPIWPYQYYDDFADSSTFHFAPGVHGKGDDIYRYPAEMYLGYRPFKKRRAHDANQRFARRNRFRLRTSKGEDAVDFPRDNLANKSSKSRFAQRKSRAETDESALASGEDYLMSGETKYTRRNTKETNETKTRLAE